MTPPIRVLIADDHTVVRAGLRALLGTVADIEVVGEAASGPEAVALTAELAPDVVLMDIQMPGGDGIEATRAITAGNATAAVLVLTMYDDDDSVIGALRAGGRGYVLKGATQQALVHAIRSVAAGHVTVGPGAAEHLLAVMDGQAARPPAFPELTERERDILALLADGHSNPVIGRRLGLSPKTVANHVSNILVKLQVADRAQAMLVARRAGLGNG